MGALLSWSTPSLASFARTIARCSLCMSSRDGMEATVSAKSFRKPLSRALRKSHSIARRICQREEGDAEVSVLRRDR